MKKNKIIIWWERRGVAVVFIAILLGCFVAWGGIIYLFLKAIQ